jgi:hypothetical protein
MSETTCASTCARNAPLPQTHDVRVNVGSSGSLLPPSPPAEKATAYPADSVRKVSTSSHEPFQILIAASLSSLFPLSFQVFHSPIDGGDQFMVPLALGPSLLRSQHAGERSQQVAFFLPSEHGVNLSSPCCKAGALSTKAKAQGGKSMTRSAEPSPTS